MAPAAPALSAESTAEEATAGVDLAGKTVVITGMSAGLGVETARVLALRGARLVGLVRDRAKGEQAADSIRAAVPGAQITLVNIELADLDSVRRAADIVVADAPRIDRLIANAGLAFQEHKLTPEGLEMNFGANHLGHFVLTARLLPALLVAAPARVTLLSSAAHRSATVDFDDPAYLRRPFDAMHAYGQSKTANALFAVGLDQRYRSRGVRAIAVHPGVIQTELGRYGDPERLQALIAALAESGVLVKSVAQGAATTVWAATAAELGDVGGVYCADCRIAPVEALDATAARGLSSVAPHALDLAAADRLWALSERLSGERWPG